MRWRGSQSRVRKLAEVDGSMEDMIMVVDGGQALKKVEEVDGGDK